MPRPNSHTPMPTSALLYNWVIYWKVCNCALYHCCGVCRGIPSPVLPHDFLWAALGMLAYGCICNFTPKGVAPVGQSVARHSWTPFGVAPLGRLGRLGSRQPEAPRSARWPAPEAITALCSVATAQFQGGDHPAAYATLEDALRLTEAAVGAGDG